MRPRKLLHHVRAGNYGNVRFTDLQALMAACGYERGYIADIPDLRACSAFGDTPQEALAEVLRAKEAWLASAREGGDAIPPPLYRPAVRT